MNDNNIDLEQQILEDSYPAKIELNQKNIPTKSLLDNDLDIYKNNNNYKNDEDINIEQNNLIIQNNLTPNEMNIYSESNNNDIYCLQNQIYIKPPKNYNENNEINNENNGNNNPSRDKYDLLQIYIDNSNKLNTNNTQNKSDTYQDNKCNENNIIQNPSTPLLEENQDSDINENNAYSFDISKTSLTVCKKVLIIISGLILIGLAILKLVDNGEPGEDLDFQPIVFVIECLNIIYGVFLIIIIIRVRCLGIVFLIFNLILFISNIFLLIFENNLKDTTNFYKTLVNSIGIIRLVLSILIVIIIFMCYDNCCDNIHFGNSHISSSQKHDYHHPYNKSKPKMMSKSKTKMKFHHKIKSHGRRGRRGRGRGHK